MKVKKRLIIVLITLALITQFEVFETKAESLNWETPLPNGVGTTLKIAVMDGNVYIANSTQGIEKYNTSTGSFVTGIATGEYLVTSIDTDGSYLYVGCKNTSSGKIDVIKYDAGLHPIAKYHNDSFYFCTVSCFGGHVYVAGGDNSAHGYIVELDANLNETGRVIKTNDNTLFYEGVSSGAYSFFTFRNSTENSGIVKIDSSTFAPTAWWEAGANYDLRNIIILGNRLIAAPRKQTAGNYTIVAINTDFSNVLKIHSIQSCWDIAIYNNTAFLQTDPQGTNEILVRNASTGLVELSYDYFSSGAYYMCMARDGSNLIVYGDDSGYKLKSIALDTGNNGSNGGGTTYSYIEQQPQTPQQYDGIYNTHHDVTSMFDFHFNVSTNGNVNYNRWAIHDRDGYTYFETPAQYDGKIKITMYSYHPVNITFLRWYYWNPNGTAEAPAVYAIYADGTQLGTYNYTVAVNGQWVYVDIPDKQGVHEINFIVVKTKGVIDTGNPTKVSISEIQIFNDDMSESFCKSSEYTDDYYLGISKWWNGLKWALSYRMDDVDSTDDAEYGNWYHHIPITWACFTDSWSSSADPALVSQYHGEWAVHAHSSSSSYHYPHWNASYSATYNEYSDTISQVENTIANGKVSPWGSTCITIHYPMSGLNPNATQALFDVGFRFGSYVGGPVKVAPAFNYMGFHRILSESSSSVTTDNLPPGCGNVSARWKYDTEPLDKYDLLETAREVMIRSNYDYAFYINVLDHIKENGSWTVINNHPGDSVPSAFWDWLANETEGWHALEGEVASWYWYKAHTSVSYNSALSNATVKVYDISISNMDPRIWHIPITFIINASKLGITSDNIYYKVRIKYANGTQYDSWHNNIGGFFATTTQHSNQTMREGWRIDNGKLYLSFIPDGKRIVLTTSNSSGNSPPTCSLSASPTSGNAPLTVTFSISASDSDGSIASWSLDVDNDGTPEYTGSGSPPATQTHTYNNPGTYTAKLTVTDNDGATAYDTVVITVTTNGNHAPVISSPSPTNGATDVSTSPTLRVVINDADGDTVTVTFYKADGSVIATDTVAGNGTASTTWSGLDYNTTYSWYVTASDGTVTTSSPTWSFTTEEEGGNGGGWVTSGGNSTWLIIAIMAFAVLAMMMIVFASKK